MTMQDRYKFRVWNKEKNEMEDDLYDSPGDIEVSCINKVFEDYLSDDRYIVEQCTGLKDKNGKLIYEGDIIRRYVGLGKHGSQKTEDIDVVKWYINGYVLENYCDYFADTDDFEVIGNIHENPDLLENKDE